MKKNEEGIVRLRIIKSDLDETAGNTPALTHRSPSSAVICRLIAYTFLPLQRTNNRAVTVISFLLLPDVTLECDPQEAVLHFASEVRCWDAEFEEEERRAATAVVLETEADSAFSVTEEGSGDGGGGAGAGVVNGGRLEAATRNQNNHQTCSRQKIINPLSINKNYSSQLISKPKPKIRIIHIFAPEIIKTDVSNFRELVQRLTGKPTNTNVNRQRRPPSSQKKLNLATTLVTTTSTSDHQEDHEEPTSCGSNKTSTTTATVTSSINGSGSLFEMKVEEEEDEVEIWSGENNGGFLNGLNVDFDGFIQELNGDFPLTTLHGF
ncbi:hypothetical protein ACFE04_029189 [Oxalis oulophora]